MSFIEILEQFNFTKSEAIVYQTLLEIGPNTGYETSKISGVPRSKIYNILESLILKGALTYNDSEKTRLYKAESIESLSENIKQKTRDSLIKLKEEGNLLNKEIKDEHIWKIKNSSLAKSRIISMIESAKKQVLIQIWADELTNEVEEALLKKQNELDEVVIILYDHNQKYKTNLKNVYKHGYEAEKLEEFKSRWLLLTIDGEQMLYITYSRTDISKAIYTRDPEMSLFAKENIVHDAYTLKLISKVNELATEDFKFELESLRNIY